MHCINCGHVNDAGQSRCAFCNFPLSDATPKSAEKEKSIPPLFVEPEKTFPDFEIPKPDFTPSPETSIPSVDPDITRSARHRQENMTPSQGIATCPQCNYQLIVPSDTCPMCSYKFNARNMPGVEFPKTEKKPVNIGIPDFEIPQPVLGTKNAEPTTPGADELVQPSDSGKQLEPTAIPEIKRKSTTFPFSEQQKRLKGTNSTIDPFRNDQAQEQIHAVLTPLSRDGEQSVESIKIVYLDAPVPLNRAMLEPSNNTITSKVQAELEYVNGAWYLVNRSEKETTFILAKSPVLLQKGDIILMGNRKFRFEG